MIKAAAIALSLCGLATPSLATEWINCVTPGGEASFDVLVGMTDILTVAGMTITVGAKVWATDPAYGPGDPTTVGQAFEDAETIRIDAMDGNAARLASLRLFKAEGETAVIYSGTLSMPGQGAWPVTCSGP
jgi:hypothetical protein